MTLSELIDQLTMIAAQLNPEFDGPTLEGLPVDPEVRIAYQPSWPLWAAIDNVRTVPSDDAPDDEDLEFAQGIVYAGDEEDPDYPLAVAMLEQEHPPIVWIAATEAAPYGESPYAPKSAWEEE